MHPIFYFIILFLSLGIFSLIAKIVAMLRSPSGVSAMDVSDLLASLFLTGFAGGCGLLVLENEYSHSMVPGFAVLAVAAMVMAVSIAIRSFAGGSKGTNTQTIDAAGLERRKAIVEKVLGYAGQSPETIDVTESPATPQKKQFTWLFFVLFILFGVVGLGFGGVSFWRGVQSKSWPGTDGVITSSSIEKHHGTGRHPSDVWGVNISYGYKVADVSYTGTRVAFGMEESSESHAQGFVDRYPVGKKVRVFYSPSNPEIAVLETGVHAGTWIGVGVGCVFFVFGIGGLIVRRRKLRTPESITA